MRARDWMLLALVAAMGAAIGMLGAAVLWAVVGYESTDGGSGNGRNGQMWGAVGGVSGAVLAGVVVTVARRRSSS